MPYCPKCGMEFVEGISICSDCKGPLLSSPEEAKALEKEAAQKALEEAQNYFSNHLPLENLPEEYFPGENPANESFAKEDLPEEILTEINSAQKAQRPPSSVYVKKSERYQDMKSSASAFLLIGCTALLLAVLIFAKVIPLTGMNQISFGGVLGIMGAGCLLVCIKTRKDAAQIKAQAEEENQKTEELLRWFLQTHSAKELDEQLAMEQGDKDCTPEELSLKRFSLIQDYLAKEQDLPDPAYVDALSEEIYNRIFEN